jgi:GNAT superfamily N-acetyltransferase
MNLEAQAEYLAYLRRAGETREVDGAFAVKTGAGSNTENGVVAHGPVADVEELVAWFADAPASWLDLGGANHDALVAIGARPENNGREIAARLADVALAAPAGVDVREVDELDEWFDLAGEDFATLRPLYERLLGPQFRLYVAPGVGFAAAFYGETTALFTHVGVMEHARRRGVATALTAARLRDAREQGCEYVVLGPSPDGAKLYASFGLEPRREPRNRWYYLPVE